MTEGVISGTALVLLLYYTCCKNLQTKPRANKKDYVSLGNTILPAKYCMCASSGLITTINNIRLPTPDSNHLCRPHRASVPLSSHLASITQATDNVPLNGPPSYPLPRQLTSSLYPPGFTTVLPSVCSPTASGAQSQLGHTAND